MIAPWPRTTDAGPTDALRPFPERQPNNMRFAVYVSIALSEAIWAKFGFSADRSAMQRLAGELYPRWHSILIHDETRLFEPLCSAIGIARESEEVLGDEGVTNMTVALGVFLDEPAKDLSRLRPRVAAAWARGETDWRELGIWPAS